MCGMERGIDPAEAWNASCAPLIKMLLESVKNPREAAAVRIADRRAHAMASVLRRYASLLAADARLEEAYRECWRGVDPYYAACIPVLVGLRAANRRRRRQSVAEVHALLQELQRVASELRRFAEGNRCFAAETRQSLQPQARDSAEEPSDRAAPPSNDDDSVIARRAAGLINKYAELATLEEELATKISSCGVHDGDNGEDDDEEQDEQEEEDQGTSGRVEAGDGWRTCALRVPAGVDEDRKQRTAIEARCAANARPSSKRRRRSGSDSADRIPTSVGCEVGTGSLEPTPCGDDGNGSDEKENINSESERNTPDSVAVVNPTPPNKVRIVSHTRVSR